MLDKLEGVGHHHHDWVDRAKQIIGREK
jgi:hypothetical protein